MTFFISKFYFFFCFFAKNNYYKKLKLAVNCFTKYLLNKKKT